MTFPRYTLPEHVVRVGGEVMQTVARLQGLLRMEDRVLAVTGWDLSDRADDVAIQVAYGMACMTLEPILLVDAAGRLHQKLGAGMSPGLRELMKGSSALEDVIWASTPDSLYFLPSGASQVPAGAALSLPEWRNATADLRRFPRVFVYAGPLRGNTNAMLVATESDAVLLALAAGLRRRREAEDLQQQLAILKSRLLGVVLTSR